jgi:hypothetical protein
LLCLHIHPNKWLIGPNGNYFVYINFHIGLYPDLKGLQVSTQAWCITTSVSRSYST